VVGWVDCSAEPPRTRRSKVLHQVVRPKDDYLRAELLKPDKVPAWVWQRGRGRLRSVGRRTEHAGLHPLRVDHRVQARSLADLTQVNDVVRQHVVRGLRRPSCVSETGTPLDNSREALVQFGRSAAFPR